MGAGFRFLHCADLHIGSAFTGLSRRIPELDGKLAETPFLAWNNTVETAIRERVDFLLVSGDCFDRNAPSLKGRIEFVRGLEKLAASGILALIVSGNHDPFPQAWSAAVKLPENVVFFFPDEVKLHSIVKEGEIVATVGGIGHSSLNVLENLAVRTGEALKAAPGVRIALVHANLCGDLHAAPASLAELTSLPVDYWALGHVHNRRILSESPWVVYSGCVQGKDVHEPGQQGCYVVDYDGFGKLSMTFHPTSVLEFETISLNISDIEDLGSVMRQLQEKLAPLKGQNDLLFRLKLTGITSLDAELRNWNQEELQSTVSSFLKEQFEGCYLEEIVLLTQMPDPEKSGLLPEKELEEALQEITDEKLLESIYADMRNTYRSLPPIRAERFEELRREGKALLAELLTGRLELKK